MDHISESIKYLRKMNNMTQDELAEKLRVSRQAISNWENGKTQPDYDILRELGVIFNQPVENILNNEINETKIGRKKNAVIPIASCMLSIIHFILSLSGYINLMGVMVSVMFASIVSLIMYFSFESSIKKRDFSMIAGHKKVDETDLSKYEKQLLTMSFIVSCLALLLNILYSALYFSDAGKQMTISMIFFAVFIIGLISSICIVNFKYKN